MVLAQRFPALGYRDFRIFWIGQFFSLIGTWMQTTIQPYLAYRLTDQPFYLGAVGFALTLPALLFMLPGGVLVERVDKRKAVIAFQLLMMAQAFILAFLTLTGRVTIWHILGLSFVLGFANAIEIIARQAMLAELVGREALPNAIALNATIFNAARVIGPSLTAPFLILLQDSGEGWAFFANGVSYLFVIIGLLRIKPIQPSNSGQSGLGSLSIQDFIEGKRYIRQTGIIVLLLLMIAIPGFLGFPFLQLIPVFARNLLQQVGDTTTIVATRNSILVTSQGVGALLASLILASFSLFRQKGKMLMAGQYAFALALVGLGFSRGLGTAIPLMALLGWGIVMQLALTHTLIQLTVPDELRGRVISAYLWVLQGSAPFGSLFLGFLVQVWGAPNTLVLSGSICLLSYLFFHVTRPTLRKLNV